MLSHEADTFAALRAVGLNMDNTPMLKNGKITEVQAREVSLVRLAHSEMSMLSCSTRSAMSHTGRRSSRKVCGHLTSDGRSTSRIARESKPLQTSSFEQCVLKRR